MIRVIRKLEITCDQCRNHGIEFDGRNTLKRAKRIARYVGWSITKKGCLCGECFKKQKEAQ